MISGGQEEPIQATSVMNRTGFFGSPALCVDPDVYRSLPSLSTREVRTISDRLEYHHPHKVRESRFFGDSVV
jgi:hypothetical protein